MADCGRIDRLEGVGNVAEACELLERVPVHGAYNVMLLDRDVNFETIAIAADQQPLKMGTRVSTNHQPGSSWPIYEEKVNTHLRCPQMRQSYGEIYTAKPVPVLNY